MGHGAPRQRPAPYRDFLHIRYQGTDKLYVPTDQLDPRAEVQSAPRAKRRSSTASPAASGSARRRRSSSPSARSPATCSRLYAQRETVPGHAFDPDTPWQREFEDSFPYEETPDQLAAIADIKRDMESPKVMDRLLCGDVGYGKTEVALRAIFKAVMGGKQAAMLAADDHPHPAHYATMLNRFAGFPVHVETISRFKTAAEQKDILRRLREGDIDVIVGTHRLLAKDVAFKNLGLLVVDEEQRFGVAHKEAIKKLKQSVDVLTLTATPIPRTAAHVHGRHPRHEPCCSRRRRSAIQCRPTWWSIPTGWCATHTARAGARRTGLRAVQPRADNRRDVRAPQEARARGAHRRRSRADARARRSRT